MSVDWKFENVLTGPWMTFENVDEIEGDKETLSSWLSDDVRDYAPTLDYIDKAISGELEDNLFWGNGFKAYIEQEYTEIHFNYEEDDPRIKPCKLPTKLLREIVAVWLEEFEKYRNSKK